MECELWPRLYVLVFEIGRSCRRSGVHYSDAVIVLVFFWACMHDRPQGWACQPRNWKACPCKLVQLPSESALSRRLRSESVLTFFRMLEDRVRGSGDPGLFKIVDGKPLPVGGYSKDPDAKRGRSAGGFAKGYKLHAIWGKRPMPEAWVIRPLNENESPIACQLVAQLSGVGYLIGDSQFDVVALHNAAITHDHQLIAPRNWRKCKNPNSVPANPHRRHAFEMLTRPFGRALRTHRDAIERKFGNATCHGGGLAPLPAWVRRYQRVCRWVQAKLILNGLRIQQRLTA